MSEQQKIYKTNRYGLNCPMDALPLQELRDLKFALSFRWHEHLRRNHTEAAESAMALIRELRREIFQREAKGVH